MGESKDLRLTALRRFAIAISILNLAGHTVLGFEQSWAAPFVGIATAYACETLLELVSAWQQRRTPRFLAGGLSFVGVVNFLLSAHITGLAVAMLLYPGEKLWPIAFAAAVGIGSKYVLRVAAPGGGSRHFLNPSNFGISLTLLAFSWVGLAQPYMFTEKLNAVGSWVLPAIIITAGTIFNGKLTHKLPLIAGWLGGFVVQDLLRWGLFGNRPLASFLPLTGVALILFTFYMVTDPATTPAPPRRQFAFGLAVAGAYGVLLAAHTVFAPFLALTAVSLLRGAALWVAARRRVTQPAARMAPAAAEPASEVGALPAIGPFAG
jgi:hypothetical protein